ncbi:MAG TPA: ATP-binding cassette domain-containing protein [Candidatus Wallbacteria bacterium]|nr:ATP-binding cassette domain-containing protein [Candidatus Wallbacteria bacterium]
MSFNKVSFSFASQRILKSASFMIRDNSKAALIGRNGSGKTTIINLIKGSLTPEDGEIVKKRDIKLGYVDQHIEERFESMALLDYIKLDFAHLYEQEKRIKELEHEISRMKDGFENSASYNSMMEEYSLVIDRYEREGGYTLNSRINSVLNGLGFSPDEYSKQLSKFSGGMKTRAQLCKLLLKEFELIILDEPTNYLDTDSLEFLEANLKNSRTAALIISHDRYFLDSVVDRVLYLYNNQIEEFPGNYSDFSEIFELRQSERIDEYERQQEFIKKTEEFYLKYKAGIKSKMARGRKKFIDRLERLNDPRIYSRNVKLDFSSNVSMESGRVIISASGLKKAFSEKLLFENAGFEIERGSITGIIGGNGAGKTTLLKMILGQDDSFEGEIKKGHNVVYGYQDQLLTGLNPKNRVIDEIWDIKRLMTEGELRKYLAKFLFAGDDVFKTVSSLSGGEKSRLIMAKIIMGGANTLILDEPTNHLDIESKEVLEQALVNFDGTIIFVSHDRYFIDKVASGLIVISDRKIKCYNGNYSYYREKSGEKYSAGRSEESARPAESLKNDKKEPKGSRTEKNDPQPSAAHEETSQDRQPLSKNAERLLKAEIEKTEAMIAENENKITEIERIFAQNSLDGKPLAYADLERLNAEYAACKKATDELYEKWQQACSKLGG